MTLEVLHVLVLGVDDISPAQSRIISPGPFAIGMPHVIVTDSASLWSYIARKARFGSASIVKPWTLGSRAKSSVVSDSPGNR